MTVGQNFILAPFEPIKRVYIAMGIMACGTLIPPLMIFTLNSLWLGWVPLTYGMIGIALGVFEGTFLSVITPLGPLTKSWAIMGFPASFFIVNVFLGSLKAAFDVPVALSFWYVTIVVAIGIPTFMHIAPHETKHDGKSYKQAGLRTSIADWRSWLVKMLPFAFVNIFSHFTMESVLPAVFNTYNAHQVSLLGPTNTTLLMKTSWFLVVFCVTMGVGDMISRRIGYCCDLKQTIHNYFALAFALSCSIVGLWLTTRGIACLVWFSAFLAFFGNGFNYAVTSKYIDKFVPRKHNLAAYSVWMFVGYCGAIAGAVLVTVVRGWICEGHVYEYQCRTDHSHAATTANLAHKVFANITHNTSIGA